MSAGIARGRSGAHILDIEVYACPPCATPETPAGDTTPMRLRDEDAQA